MQRSAVTACRDLGFRLSRLAACEIRSDGDERIQLRLERCSARQQRVGVFERRELAPTYELGRLRDAQEVQLAVQFSTYTGVKSWYQFLTCTKPFTFGDIARGATSCTTHTSIAWSTT